MGFKPPTLSGTRDSEKFSQLSRLLFLFCRLTLLKVPALWGMWAFGKCLKDVALSVIIEVTVEYPIVPGRVRRCHLEFKSCMPEDCHPPPPSIDHL